MPADRVEHLDQIGAEIIDGTNRKERIHGLQQVQLILDVAEHHLAAADIESALLPGDLETLSLLVPLLLQLERKHLFLLLREK